MGAKNICKLLFYGAFLTKGLFADSVVPLNLPPTGLTFRVAMNTSSESLIGGTNGLDAYATFVAPDGSITPFSGLIAPGEIYTVSINESGEGMIGGVEPLDLAYAALTSPSGIVTPLTGLSITGGIFWAGCKRFRN